MNANMFAEVDLKNEPWGLTLNRMKQLIIQLLANPAPIDERAVQVFVREALLQVDAEPRLIHKAIVIDVQQALERILALGVPVNPTNIVEGGADWLRRYGLSVTCSEKRTDSVPYFFVLWKEQRGANSLEKSSLR